VEHSFQDRGRYLKAGKRGQLLSKLGTVRRWVEEVLWRTSVEDFETSLTLDKLNETSNDKEDVMLVSRGRFGWGAMTAVASQLSTASEDHDATDESGRRFGGDYCATAQVLLWALRPVAQLWIPLLKTWRYRSYLTRMLVLVSGKDDDRTVHRRIVGSRC